LDEESIGKRCLDLLGEDEQIYQMIEEGAELTAALCHRRRGRYNADHVYEEIADCLIVLGSMDQIFGKIKASSISPDPPNNIDMISLNLIIVIGELQPALIRYLSMRDGAEKIKSLFHLYRQYLNRFAIATDADAVERWKVIKLKRTLRRTEAGEARKKEKEQE